MVNKTKKKSTKKAIKKSAKKSTKKSIKKILPKKRVKEKKKLTRTIGEKRMISGVLAGIAEYINYDPTIVRLLFILLVLFTGVLPGILIYILAVLLIPKQVF